MERRRLGASELEVSRLALGSWRTFERISREDSLAVMRATREYGFNFLDDARYDDETGQAPIPTGYSEVLFGELFRAAGWDQCGRARDRLRARQSRRSERPVRRHERSSDRAEREGARDRCSRAGTGRGDVRAGLDRRPRAFDRRRRSGRRPDAAGWNGRATEPSSRPHAPGR
jgi:hypothetical protein